ncbi:TPA: BrnT family toxin, partial [Mannheimia haemolytica]|nr:BrnT family toxin [Mannheimia haemolytica]
MKIYTWDETKRKINLAKHGLDFADADEVLSSPYRF